MLKSMMTLSHVKQSILVLSILALSACTTIVEPPAYVTAMNKNTANTVNGINQSVNTIQDNLKLDSQITQKLAMLTNEVQVNNLSHVTHQAVSLDGERYIILSFHTLDNQVYRTRVLESKLNAKTLQQLQQLKGATFIGYMPISGYSQQFFFRNYKDLIF